MWLELFRRLRKLAIDGIECVSANGATATRSSKTTKEFKISDFPYKFKVCSALIKDDPQANVRHRYGGRPNIRAEDRLLVIGER